VFYANKSSVLFNNIYKNSYPQGIHNALM